MLIDQDTFYEVRRDTLACLLRFPPLYFKYATGAVRALLDVIDSADIVDEESVAAVVETINAHLFVLRSINVFYHRLGDEENVAHLRGLLGDDADIYASVHGVSSFDVACHTPVRTTTTLPVPIDVFNKSTFSVTHEIGRVSDPVSSFMGEGSGYVSGVYVSRSLGGTLDTKEELVRGQGPVALETFINTYPRDEAVSLRVRQQPYILYPGLSITDDNRAEFEGLVASSARWVVRTERVTFEGGLGHTGDIYRYTPNTSLYEISDLLREGDALTGSPHVKVKEVLGHRVTLTSPVVIKGEASFCSPDYVAWSKRARAFIPIDVVATSERERVAELGAIFVKLKNELIPLLRTGASPREGIAFDIKEAHYNVGANHAYNLLERGRFDEYYTLTDTHASTSKLLSAAAQAIKAGTLL